MIGSTIAVHRPIGWGIFVYSGFIFAIIACFVLLTRQGISARGPKNFAAKLAEQLYFFIEGLCCSVIGPHGKRYIPFILSLWLIIFTSNVIGLVLPHTPTADWGMNLSLSFITIAFVQYEGIRANGLIGHLKHFAGPKLPILLALFITPLLFSIEIISETVRVLSLSLRLYSNIYGGHLVVDAMNHLVSHGEWPIGGLIFPIEFLSSIIQALVFTMLTCVYLSIATAHESSH